MQLASPIICFLKKAETIKAITKALEEKLKTNGRLLMVHWTLSLTITLGLAAEFSSLLKPIQISGRTTGRWPPSDES
jgi:hypothetical protein